MSLGKSISNTHAAGTRWPPVLIGVLIGALIGLLAGSVAPRAAPAGPLPGPGAPEIFVGDENRLGKFDPGDLTAAFAAVFSALPDEVWVRPSGNYLYFAYRRSGVVRRGNFRLDAADRDRGVIHFALHGEDGPARSRGRAFGRADGVKVTGVTPFVYVVHYNRKAVVFRLNDLSGVAPGAVQMRSGETYLGPIADESGIGFFLLWDAASRTFLYILDEARQTEQMARTPVSPQIRIGARSGFAYYRDRYASRWILAGVRAAEVARNGFFDGPFDQMPENRLDGEVLRQALEAARPALKGRIDRFGNSADLMAKVLVRPYMLYVEPDALVVLDQCAARARGPDDYYRCFRTGQMP